MYDDIFSQEQMIKAQQLLENNQQTITCAESCTGGLIASYITQNSGSSNIFNGSIVSYSNEIKNQELGVRLQTLENFGAVSKETVEEMLLGSLVKFKANYSIAVSGIAGPTGGSKNKPVGTVVIGVMGANRQCDIEVFYFKGERKAIQIQAAKTALKKFSKFLQKSLDK